MGYVYDHARARASDLSGFPRNARETIGILGSRSQILRGFFLRPFFPFFFLFFFLREFLTQVLENHSISCGARLL